MTSFWGLLLYPIAKIIITVFMPLIYYRILVQILSNDVKARFCALQLIFVCGIVTVRIRIEKLLVEPITDPNVLLLDYLLVVGHILRLCNVERKCQILHRVNEIVAPFFPTIYCLFFPL